MISALALSMTLAMPDAGAIVRLAEPGRFVIVPGKTWHTACVHAPTKMLFVTPGEGTLNAEQPERAGS